MNFDKLLHRRCGSLFCLNGGGFVVRDIRKIFFAGVGRFGDIMVEGQWSSDEEVSVRPAMWVDLNKVKEVGGDMP